MQVSAQQSVEVIADMLALDEQTAFSVAALFVFEHVAVQSVTEDCCNSYLVFFDCVLTRF